MKRKILFLLSLLMCLTASAQQLNLRVASFQEDPTDLTRVSKIDKGSGDPYALVKVTSDNPDDDLSAYRFQFGMMAHEQEAHDGELWLYVQKNAKHVTIQRDGYRIINRQELGYTLEAGKVYRMVLSAQTPVVRTQMVMFKVNPTHAKAVVMIQRDGGTKELFGTVDETGAVAKNLEFGTYTYEVMAENYHSTEGRITLNNQEQTYTETVTLRLNGATVTLRVDADADIYVNNDKKGTRTWNGLLKAGTYTVECRQQNHRNSQQSITVTEGQAQTFNLTPPSPITGTLSLTSNPLGASIKIDGKDFGTTPRNITNLIIGQHEVTLTRDGYYETKQTFEVRENETTSLTVAINTLPERPEELTFTVKGVTFKMIKVEAGTFQMGSNDGNSDQKPVHSVTLTQDYYMGETEVTQGLWTAVMGSNPSNYKNGDDYPVELVSYEGIKDFLTKLNTQLASQLPLGKSFRLPTEAEWEFAAKGGNKSKGYTYSGSNTIGDVAWYDSNSSSKTHPVGTKAANELGLYDMSGNVYEWCYDWYGDYSSSAQTDPTGPATGPPRVSRGGSWYHYATDCRSANRYYAPPTYRSFSIGFRLAL